jgi:hypothetical protein
VKPSRTDRLVYALALSGLLALPAIAADEGKAEDPPPQAYWSQGNARPFVALDLEAGAYVKAIISAGYGRPHWLWGGVEGYAFETLDMGVLYGGIRANLLAADLQLGVRQVWSQARGTAPRASSHSIDDFDSAPSHVAYTTLVGELSGGLPIPTGYILYDFEALHVTDVPQGQDLFDEWDHVVTNSGSLVAERLGYVAALGKNGFLKVGPMADLTESFGRGTTARIGALGIVNLTDHLDLVGLLLWPVRSPDELGFKGTFGTLRLRWQWASGESKPGFH